MTPPVLLVLAATVPAAVTAAPLLDNASTALAAAVTGVGCTADGGDNEGAAEESRSGRMW